MAFHTDRGWWRKTAAIAVLPFAALGIAGCDNAETGGEEVEQEAPAEEEAEQEAPVEEEAEQEAPVEEEAEDG